MVRHPRNLKILKLTKLLAKFGALLKNTMPKWKTTLSQNNQDLSNVNIKRGIFQGDSLSSILFIMAMLPLNFLLKRELPNVGFQIGNFHKVINHLDDLKLYLNLNSNLNNCQLLYTLSPVISPCHLDLEKCASLHLKHNGVIVSNGIELPNGEIINIDQDGYKYLGNSEVGN